MTQESLWGEWGSLIPERTPTTVLKEQATALSELTKGVLFGRVVVNNLTSGKFDIVLSIVAPAVNDYEFDVLHVRHGIDLYPATVLIPPEPSVPRKEVACTNEDELKTALASILGSDRVRQVIGALIAQSRAT
ncbi:MAG: hypothetical protein M1376_01115 [Planctomycetes bacterium]|nr:hypothetical protein [Planctomycetota bacterium]